MNFNDLIGYEPRVFVPKDRESCIYRETSPNGEKHCMYTYDDGSEDEIKPYIPCKDNGILPPPMCPFRDYHLGVELDTLKVRQLLSGFK